jgi:hypothetical protein
VPPQANCSTKFVVTTNPDYTGNPLKAALANCPALFVGRGVRSSTKPADAAWDVLILSDRVTVSQWAVLRVRPLEVFWLAHGTDSVAGQSKVLQDLFGEGAKIFPPIIFAHGHEAYERYLNKIDALRLCELNEYEGKLSELDRSLRGSGLVAVACDFLWIFAVFLAERDSQNNQWSKPFAESRSRLARELRRVDSKVADLVNDTGKTSTFEQFRGLKHALKDCLTAQGALR